MTWPRSPRASPRERGTTYVLMGAPRPRSAAAPRLARSRPALPPAARAARDRPADRGRPDPARGGTEMTPVEIVAVAIAATSMVVAGVLFWRQRRGPLAPANRRILFPFSGSDSPATRSTQPCAWPTPSTRRSFPPIWPRCRSTCRSTHPSHASAKQRSRCWRRSSSGRPAAHVEVDSRIETRAHDPPRPHAGFSTRRTTTGSSRLRQPTDPTASDPTTYAGSSTTPGASSWSCAPPSTCRCAMGTERSARSAERHRAGIRTYKDLVEIPVLTPELAGITLRCEQGVPEVWSATSLSTSEVPVMSVESVSAPGGLVDLARRPALSLRVFVWRSRLDYELAAGADPGARPALALRAAQLVHPRHRRKAAACVERLVEEFDADRGWWFSAAIPFLRDQVAEARGTLLWLAEAFAPPSESNRAEWRCCAATV